jgi:hypothetical protein
MDDIYVITISRIRTYKFAKDSIRRSIDLEEKIPFIQGMCLYKIKEEGWWQSEYESFEQMCKKEFGKTKSWGYGQIDAYLVSTEICDVPCTYIGPGGTEMSTNGGQLITNERQARELASLDTEQERANALRAAAATAPIVDGKPKISGSAIRKAANVIKPEKKKKPAKKQEAEPTGQEWCKHQVNQLRAINKSLHDWKKKHAKGNANWDKAIEGMKMAHAAFVALGKLKS